MNETREGRKGWELKKNKMQTRHQKNNTGPVVPNTRTPGIPTPETFTSNQNQVATPKVPSPSAGRGQGFSAFVNKQRPYAVVASANSSPRACAIDCVEIKQIITSKNKTKKQVTRKNLKYFAFFPFDES